MNMPIKGMKEVREENKTFYFTEEMLNEGIYSCFRNFVSPEETPEAEKSICDGTITFEVVYIESKEKKVISKVEGYNLYMEELWIEPLQKYILIKSIYDLYSSYSKEEFIEWMRELAYENEINEYNLEDKDLDYIQHIHMKSWAEETLAEYISLKNQRLEKTS